MTTKLVTRALSLVAAAATSLSVLVAIPPASATAPPTPSSSQVVSDDYLVIDRVVDHGNAANHVRVFARDADQGEYVVMTPSLGRGVEDFTEAYGSTITTRLVRAGYRVVLIQPRGIGRSVGTLNPAVVTMKLLVDDVKQTLDALGVQRAHFVGHAYGNRQSRALAAFYPEYVEDVTLLAAGGDSDLSDEQYNNLLACFDLTLPDAQRLPIIQKTFFAEQNDASVWLRGWYPRLAMGQVAAVRSIDEDFFDDAGGRPILLFQATDDYIAPPEMAGIPLAEELGDQVSYVEVHNAGHALTSERPDTIAARMIAYYRR